MTLSSFQMEDLDCLFRLGSVPTLLQASVALLQNDPVAPTNLALSCISNFVSAFSPSLTRPPPRGGLSVSWIYKTHSHIWALALAIFTMQKQLFPQMFSDLFPKRLLSSLCSNSSSAISLPLVSQFIFYYYNRVPETGYLFKKRDFLSQLMVYENPTAWFWHLTSFW